MEAITPLILDRIIAQQHVEVENFRIPSAVNVVLKDNTQVFKNMEFSDAVIQVRISEVTFINCKFSKLALWNEVYVTKITLIDCTVQDLSYKGVPTIRVGTFEISGPKTQITNLKFDRIECQEFKLDKVPEIKSGSINIKCLKFTLKETSNIELLHITGEVKETFSISNCTKFGLINLYNVVGHRFECHDSPDLLLYFDTIDYNYVNFHRNENIKLEFNYAKANSIGIHEGNYKEIEFTHDCNFNLSIKNDAIIDTLKLLSTRIPKDRTLFIENTTIKELVFENLYNEGMISFIDCEIQDGLRLYKSSFAKSQFTSVRLGKECRVDILDSNFTDTLFNSFIWRKKYKLFEKYDPWVQVRYATQQTFLIALRESYRQLKTNYLKNGNKIEALEFQKNEMNIHYQVLSANKYSSFRNLGNFLIVGTNKWFSDFGQNIWKPLVWLLLSHLVIFNMILLNSNLGIQVASSWDAIDIPMTWKSVGLYFHTLLPTHPFVLKGVAPTDVPIPGFWDFASRVLSGYFIYYFISASRKYHQ